MRALILIIDHFDSFSHNLYQALSSQHQGVEVVRCDKVSVADIEDMKPRWVILSPGPRGPKNTGVTLEYLKSSLAENTPTLGICLGFQAMAVHWGARVLQAGEVVHGKTLDLTLSSHPILEGLPSPLQVARYHSLGVSSSSLPNHIETLGSHKEMAMAVIDTHKPWVGLQFHPESFLTPQGPELLLNIARWHKLI